MDRLLRKKHMRHIAIALATIFFALPAFAQQTQGLTPGAVCGQLRAQDTAQILALTSEIDRLQGELKALKAKEAEASKPKDTLEK
jgi:hypothetical protein